MSPAYIDPLVREAVKRINLHAVQDYARSIAHLHRQGYDITRILNEAAAAYVQAVRGWVAGENVDPSFGAVTDSFVRRADKGLINDLGRTLGEKRLSPRQAEVVWAQFDRLHTLDEKRRFVYDIRQD